jgi:hypothetical protein
VKEYKNTQKAADRSPIPYDRSGKGGAGGYFLSVPFGPE